jgi:hypothetical protein
VGSAEAELWHVRSSLRTADGCWVLDVLFRMYLPCSAASLEMITISDGNCRHTYLVIFGLTLPRPQSQGAREACWCQQGSDARAAWRLDFGDQLRAVCTVGVPGYTAATMVGFPDAGGWALRLDWLWRHGAGRGVSVISCRSRLMSGMLLADSGSTS